MYDLTLTVSRVDSALIHIFPGSAGHRVRDIRIDYVGPASGFPAVLLYINGSPTGGTDSENDATPYPSGIGTIARYSSSALNSNPRIILAKVRVGGNVEGVSVNEVNELSVGGDITGNLIAQAAGATQTAPGTNLGRLGNVAVAGSIFGDVETTGQILSLTVGNLLGGSASNHVYARENIGSIIVGPTPPVTGVGELRATVAGLLTLQYLTAPRIVGDIYCRNLGSGGANTGGIRAPIELVGKVLVAASFASGNNAPILVGAIRNQITIGGFNYIDSSGNLQPNPAFGWFGNLQSTFSGGTFTLPNIPNPPSSTAEYNAGAIGGGAAGVLPFTLWKRDCSPPTIAGNPGVISSASFQSGGSVIVNHNGPVALKTTSGTPPAPVTVEYLNYMTNPPSWGGIAMNQQVTGRSVVLTKVNGVTYPNTKYRVRSQNLKSVVTGARHPAVSFPNVADVSYVTDGFEFLLGGCMIGGNVNPADIVGGGFNGLVPDGIVDGNDYVAFINSFTTGDPSLDPLADISGGNAPNRIDGGPDGIIDGSDFITFINNFSVGC